MNHTTDPGRVAVEAIYDTIGPPRLRYCPWTPTIKQEAFLLLEKREAFFGGAAGPGKSAGLLMAALQYVDVPGYHALLLRPTLAELDQAGALIALAHDFLGESKASWLGEKRRWTFPGGGKRAGSDGATLNFGYLADDSDVGRYSGASYAFLGFDELTRFQELHYRRMFKVLRKPNNTDNRLPAAPDGTRLQDVPIRLRSASNPGGPGHTWVRARFVDPITRLRGIAYLPALFTDNPHRDPAEYAQWLAEMPSLDRARLLNGDWDVSEEGDKFRREWFTLVSPDQVEPPLKAVRYWDLAATEPSPRNRDPDYTVGLLLELNAKGIFTIRDIVRGRWSERDVEDVVRQTAKQDGTRTPIYIEQEPGSAGKLLLSHFQRTVLRGYICHPGLSGGADKEMRARPVAAAASYGLVRILPNPHLHAFLDEVSIFPNGAHDDIVDALSGAHNVLAKAPSGRSRIGNPNRVLDPQTGRPIRLPSVIDRSRYAYMDDAELAARLGVPIYNYR
jgi:predicted phage terminase large subunit-like protein